MSSLRDDFSEPTKRALAARVNLRCSRCRASTSGPQVDPSKSVNVGVAAHITAAAPGGSRYDPRLTPEQRADISNSIWLCQNCAKLVDNDPVRFGAGLLREWKARAEEEALALVGKSGDRGSAGPTRVSDVLAKAYAALYAHDYSVATLLLREAALNDPSHRETSLLLGLTLIAGTRLREMHLVKIREAERYLAIALSDAETRGKALVLLAALRFEYYRKTGIRPPAPALEDVLEELRVTGVSGDALEVLNHLALDPTSHALLRTALKG